MMAGQGARGEGGAKEAHDNQSSSLRRGRLRFLMVCLLMDTLLNPWCRHMAS